MERTSKTTPKFQKFRQPPTPSSQTKILVGEGQGKGHSRDFPKKNFMNFLHSSAIPYDQQVAQTMLTFFGGEGHNSGTSGAIELKFSLRDQQNPCFPMAHQSSSNSENGFLTPGTFSPQSKYLMMNELGDGPRVPPYCRTLVCLLYANSLFRPF